MTPPPPQKKKISDPPTPPPPAKTFLNFFYPPTLPPSLHAMWLYQNIWKKEKKIDLQLYLYVFHFSNVFDILQLP